MKFKPPLSEIAAQIFCFSGEKWKIFSKKNEILFVKDCKKNCRTKWNLALKPDLSIGITSII